MFNKKRQHRKVDTRSGFVLIEALVAVAMLGFAALGVTTISSMVQKNITRTGLLNVVMNKQNAVDAAIKSPTAWHKTVLANPNLACIVTAPGCNPSSESDGYYLLILMGDDGEKISNDPADPTTRWTKRGAECPSGISDPDSQCPIRYVARWRPLCSAYPCLNPSLEIKVNLQTDFLDSSIPLNLKKYSFSTIRGINPNDVQEACQVLNGVYNVINNTCLPKYSGQSCASLGIDNGIVTALHSNGSIECKPLYKGTCNPNAEIVSGFDSAGNVQCAPKVCPCKYSFTWSACSVACGGGIQWQIMNIISPPLNGGAACPVARSQSCNTQACPQNCSGSWGTCSAACGPGTQTYSITQAAQGGGLSCPFPSGATQACNNNCPVSCQGSWGACSKTCGGGGVRYFSVTQPSQNGGANCAYANGAADLTCADTPCPVDCQGSFGACSVSCGGGSQIFTMTTAPANGGLSCSAKYGAGVNGNGDVVNGCNSQACLPASGKQNVILETPCMPNTWAYSMVNSVVKSNCTVGYNIMVFSSPPATCTVGECHFYMGSGGSACPSYGKVWKCQ